MKKRKSLIITGIAIVLIPVLFIWYNKFKKQNIYDEMYYAGAGATGKAFEKPRSHFGKIPSIIRGPQLVNELIEVKNDTITTEQYDTEKLENSINNLYIEFHTKNKKMIIHYGYTIAEGITIQFDNVYHTQSKQLKKRYYITDELMKDHVDNPKEIVDY